jgi:hypothetical protein
MGNKVSLEENLIDLKIVAKQMVRSSKKCEKNEAAAISKLKKVSCGFYFSSASERNNQNSLYYRITI